MTWGITKASDGTSAPTSPLDVAWGRHAPLNTAHTHPVFFTSRLRKSPSASSPPSGDSPVVHGYIYQDGQRIGQGTGNSPKL